MVLNDAEIYYSFDDGDLVTDLSGNGNNGTNNGATTGATGIINGGFSLDGVNDTIDTNFSYTSTNAVSTNIWIKTTQNNTTISGISILRGGSPDGINLLNGKVWARIRGGTAFVDSVSIDDNNFHMLTLTFDGSICKFYRDGVFISNVTAGAVLSTENILIGARFVGSAFVAGVFDEFGVWFRELSVSEISNLYNSGAGFNPYSSTPTLKKSSLLFASDL